MNKFLRNCTIIPKSLLSHCFLLGDLISTLSKKFICLKKIEIEHQEKSKNSSLNGLTKCFKTDDDLACKKSI